MTQLPDHFSVSQLTTFLSCSLAYRFRYVDHVETGLKSSSFALGTAFHCAAEQLHKDMIAGTVREQAAYLAVFDDSLDLEFGNFDVQLKAGESIDSLHQEGRALLSLYCEHRVRQPAKLVAAELCVKRPLVNIATGDELDVPFVAYLDLVERDGGNIAVVDLKTAARAYAQDDVDANLQLTAYALLMLLQAGKAPEHLRIDALIRTKTPKLQQLVTTRCERDFLRFFELARIVRAAIEEGNYYPNAGWACSNCEFARECGDWGLAAESSHSAVKGGISSACWNQSDRLGRPGAGHAAGDRVLAVVADVN